MPILIQGATGTGKELVAQHIHALSRRPGVLVDVNCGALPREMAESLLFGHCRGAFTGAFKDVAGHIESADGGTLLFDELLDLTLDAQVKLLRALESGRVQRLGEQIRREVDLRVVSTVQDDLPARLASGALRADLYQRLGGVVIRLPTLLERPEDVVDLAVHFAAREGRRLEPGSERLLAGYPWPGNVRELQLAIERAGFLVDNGTLPASVLAEAIDLGAPKRRSAESGTGDGNEARPRLMDLCERHCWDVAAAARSAGMGVSTLYRRLQSCGISARHFRRRGESLPGRENL
jgi:DNA-binding NtrC family response regulator